MPHYLLREAAPSRWDAQACQWFRATNAQDKLSRRRSGVCRSRVKSTEALLVNEGGLKDLAGTGEAISKGLRSGMRPGPIRVLRRREGCGELRREAVVR